MGGHNYVTSLLYYCYYVASNFARRSIRFVSPTVWNSLPSDVQSNPSQATFKSRVKTHLFNIAFDDQPEL